MLRNPALSFEAPQTIEAFQNQALTEALVYLDNCSHYYQRLFRSEKIDISRIKNTADLRNIPVTTKKELQQFNQDFICVEPARRIDYVTTSGTLGDPVSFVLTDADLQRLAYNEFLSFQTAGCTRQDIMQLMTTMDRMFMAGLAYFMGAREMGMGIARVGNGIPQLQWNTIHRIHPTVLMVVPSFLLKLAQYASEQGIDHRNTPLQKAICIGETLRNSDFTSNTLACKIAEQWPDLKLFSTYASTEMQSSFTECGASRGGHLPPELIIVEFLDEENRPVPQGEPGEVTITTLGVEGMPLLRFKTGDICTGHSEPCPCGRNTLRLGPVIGRRGQMIKYKGTTLYPPVLFDVLEKVEGIINYVIEVYTNDIGTDELLIRVGARNPSAEFSKQIKDLFRSIVRVAPGVSFESPELISRMQLPEMSRKAIKFIDRRQKGTGS